MKKMIALLMSALMLTSALTACGTPSASGGASASGGKNAAGSKKELVMWGSWSGDQVGQLQQQLKSYNDSQNEVTVKYAVQDSMEEKLLTAIAGGELPDVVLWDRYNTDSYAAKGALEPIDDRVKKDNVDLKQFYDPAVDEMTYDGKLYGIPLLVDTRILFYNKTLLKEANVDPASIKTWDDLESAAVKLTKRDGGKLTQAGFSLKDQGLFNIWLKQAGGKLVNDTNPPTTAFNSPEGLEVLNFWDKLLHKDKVYDIGFEDGFGGNGFKAGKVAITYDGPWSLADYKKANIDFGVMEAPVGPKGDKGAYTGGFGLVIPKGAKNADASWSFIKWWTTNPENGVNFAKISGWLPANKKAANDSYFTQSEQYAPFVKALDYATIRPKNTGYSDVEGLALIPQLQKFVAKEISAQGALKQAQTQGDKIFADAAKK